MKVLRIFMGSVALLLTVAALLCAFANFWFFNPECYEDDIFRDGFFEAALRERDRALDELESVVVVEREALLVFLTTKVVGKCPVFTSVVCLPRCFVVRKMPWM